MTGACCRSCPSRVSRIRLPLVVDAQTSYSVEGYVDGCRICTRSQLDRTQVDDRRHRTPHPPQDTPRGSARAHSWGFQTVRLADRRAHRVGTLALRRSIGARNLIRIVAPRRFSFNWSVASADSRDTL